MKKIKALIRKLRSQMTVSMHKRPLLVTLLMLLLVNLAIMMLAAFLATVADSENYPNFGQGFIGALTWIFSSNSIRDLEDIHAPLALYLICGFTIVTGLVLFTGTIIAITTNALKEHFSNKANNKGKLILENHLVILNWNSKVPDIVIDLMHEKTSPVILVLSNMDKKYVELEIKNALSKIKIKEKLGKIKLLIREGDPLNRSELNDVSLSSAKSIAIMANEEQEYEDKKLEGIDLTSLRLLLAVGDIAKKDTNVVIEVDSYESVRTLNGLKKTMDSIKNLKLSVFSFNRKLGQIMAETIIQPGLFTVLSELFSYEGAQFASTEKISIKDYLSDYTNGIPIINMNKLYVLVDSEDDIKKKRVTPYKTDRRLKIHDRIYNHKYDKTLFIVGDNRRVPYMMENIKGTTEEEYINIVKLKKDENKKLIKQIKETTGPKEVLILSDDTVEARYHDANVFATLIALNNHISDHIPVIAEILDSRNYECMTDFKVNNTIVSNHLISLLIAQLLTNEASSEFYESLLTINKDDKNDIDIMIRSVGDVLDLNQDLKFSSYAELVNSFYYSLNRRLMLIGVRRNGVNTYLAKDMDKTPIELTKDDKLIMIIYNKLREE